MREPQVYTVKRDGKPWFRVRLTAAPQHHTNVMGKLRRVLRDNACERGVEYETGGGDADLPLFDLVAGDCDQRILGGRNLERWIGEQAKLLGSGLIRPATALEVAALGRQKMRAPNMVARETKRCLAN